ncbi:S8 family serine peptidase [Microbacterium sp. NPDC057650]|uniref:S8 family serine peptidase n=1 Tax=unclassified Microbacterium TaxID=2609290 RepID=UPI00366D27DE
MSTRRRLMGAACAALVATAMVVTPMGASAAPAPVDPDGPFAAGHHGIPAPGALGAGKTGAGTKDAGTKDAADLYEKAQKDGFTPIDSTGSSAVATEKLGAADTRMLQQAQAAEKKTVTVLMVAKKGATDDVIGAVQKAGGHVGAVTDKLGYVRATVPTDEVSTLAGLSAVRAIDLDRTYKVPSPGYGTPGESAKAAPRAAAPAAPGGRTPADNPYLPIGETGATTFTDQHPSWDGRGTVVGVLDTGVDIDHPALQKTSDGKPKIVDWVTATDPVTDGDGTWVQMSLKKSGPSFTSAGMTWTAPAGDFEFGYFYEMATSGSDFGGDLDRDGRNTTRWGVLYEPTTHKIWVDSDNDQDFTDEGEIAPYAVDQQVGHLGTDDPNTATNERIPFVVEYRDDVDLSALGGSNVGKTADYVNIGLASASHGTHVAGIIAGTSMLGGEMRGAAPGAQIVSSRACTWGGGCTTAALTEGMIDLVMNRNVDVVNLSIGGLPALNDGSDVIAMLYDTLIEGSGVQIIVAAGNDGLGTNTVSSPSVANKAISVAASVSARTWWADYGSLVSAKQNIFGFSSRGPAEDGSFAPQVSAPGAAVSSIPMWLDGQAVPEAGYALPVGYGMLNGTSMAAPQVTGATALLLSAAKARSIQADPAAIKTALTGTAKPIAGVPAAAQGTGIIDTAGAWRQLAKKVSVNTLKISAPVCTSLSDALPKPGTGDGIYNRCLPGGGGQVVGTSKSYTVSVERTDGSTRSVAHKIGWIGNDGTFKARSSLPLKRDDAADVTVTAKAAKPGVHSAIMTIDDPATVGIDQFVNVTVLATQPLKAPGFSATTSGTLPRAGSTSLLVPVPEGVEALQLTLDGVAANSQVRVLPIDPDGIPADSNASNHCYTNYADPAKCDPNARAVYRPKAGVWEFVIEARRTSGTDANTYKAAVSLQGMTFDPKRTTLDAVTMNAPTDLAATGKNVYGPVTAHVAAGEVGTVRNLFSTVTQGQLTANQLFVPRGTTRLDAMLTPRTPADLDFYVYFNGRPIGQGTTSGNGAERIIVDNPKPGTYYIVVTGMAVPEGGVTFDYHQEMYSVGQGTITGASDATFDLASGATMPVAGDLTVAARQLTGDPMVARMRVANEHGTFIGAVDVDIAKVEVPQLDVVKWAPPFVGAALTDDGMVAGDRQYNARMTPTTWTAEDGFVNLSLDDSKYGAAMAMNQKREASGIATDSALHNVPATWAADGALTVIGNPDWRAYSAGYATGINGNGVVAGFSEATIKESDGKYHNYSDGFVRTAEGGFRKLEHLSDNLAGDQPRAINDAGTIVGNSLTTEWDAHAVTWDAATGAIRDLGTLPGQYSAQANDVNATGAVVGTSGDDAFVWTRNGGMKRLADYGYNATAEKISDDGWILGTVELDPDYAVSALWDPQGRLWDVSGMVPVEKGSYFVPTYSFDINNRGQLMVYGEGGPGQAPSSTVMLGIPAALTE